MTSEKNKKIGNTALICLCGLILIGTGLSVYLLRTEREVIVLDIEAGQRVTVPFDALSLIPGERCEYTFRLRSESIGSYRLAFAWEDRVPGSTLKDFARVRMEKDGELLCDELLADLFAHEGMALTADLGKDAKNEFKIICYLPQEVGNEAQDAEAKFDLIVTATDKWGT